MTTLSDLTLTPERMAEQLALRERIAGIAARAEPHRKAEAPSRADLHALLDACLDLAEMRDTNERFAAFIGRDGEAAKAARVIGHALARGAFGWTEPGVPHVMQFGSKANEWIRLEESPDLWRYEMAHRLARSPHVLPPRAMRALVEALRRLNDGSGDVPWLLVARRDRGNGRNPRERRFMEQAAWCWIHREKGAGRRIGDAIADVASAVNRSAPAVQKWREMWKEDDGEEVDAVLTRHEEIGAGKEPPLDLPPHQALLCLSEIAERWLAAVGRTEERELSAAKVGRTSRRRT